MPGQDLVAFQVRGRLSPREHVVLQLISRGHTNKRVAQSLGITPETVKSHTKHIFVKLGAQSRLEAVMRGLTLGLLRMR
jgi:LuxR family maltose regulon positive regulatory protein